MKSFSQFSALNLERIIFIDGNIRYQPSFTQKSSHTLRCFVYTVKHLIWYVVLKTPPKYLQFSEPSFFFASTISFYFLQITEHILWSYVTTSKRIKYNTNISTHVICCCLLHKWFCWWEATLPIYYTKKYKHVLLDWIVLCKKNVGGPFWSFFSLQILSITIHNTDLANRLPFSLQIAWSSAFYKERCIHSPNI